MILNNVAHMDGARLTSARTLAASEQLFITGSALNSAADLAV